METKVCTLLLHLWPNVGCIYTPTSVFVHSVMSSKSIIMKERLCPEFTTMQFPIVSVDI
jgi:hypothetical protein